MICVVINNDEQEFLIYILKIYKIHNTKLQLLLSW